MSRRAFAVVLALVLALPAAFPAATAAAAGGYEHAWKLQGIASGETGRHEKTVLHSDLTFTRTGDSFSGVLSYADIVGATSGDTFSQSSEMRLVLEGERVTGRQVAAGSFVGTATLALRDADSPAGGADPSALSAPARGTVVYRVAGRWVADLDGTTAAGELLFELAEPLTVTPDGAVVREVSWFNRLSNEFPDDLGASQTFAVRVGGDDAPAAGFGETVARGARGDAWTADPVTDAETIEHVMRLKSGLPGSEGRRTAIGLDLAGPYLDAKNRAAGLLGDDGPLVADAGRLAAAWKAAEAATGTVGPPSVLAATAAATRQVRDAKVPRKGAAADAVLAAADSPDAPAAAVDVARMERKEVLDVVDDDPVARSVLMGLVKRPGGGAVTLPDGSRVEPEVWLAYLRADGAVFWLPEEGAEYALTDASLLGWGYRTHRAHLVESAHVGRVHAAYRLD